MQFVRDSLCHSLCVPLTVAHCVAGHASSLVGVAKFASEATRHHFGRCRCSELRRFARSLCFLSLPPRRPLRPAPSGPLSDRAIGRGAPSPCVRAPSLLSSASARHDGETEKRTQLPRHGHFVPVRRRASPRPSGGSSASATWAQRAATDVGAATTARAPRARSKPRSQSRGETEGTDTERRKGGRSFRARLAAGASSVWVFADRRWKCGFPLSGCLPRLEATTSASELGANVLYIDSDSRVNVVGTAPRGRRFRRASRERRGGSVESTPSSEPRLADGV